jgi:hypothetical protein
MDNKGKILFFGVLIGAITGLVAAILINRRTFKDPNSTAITTGEGLKLGVMVFGLLRAIASLSDDEKK